MNIKETRNLNDPVYYTKIILDRLKDSHSYTYICEYEHNKHIWMYKACVVFLIRNRASFRVCRWHMAILKYGWTSKVILNGQHASRGPSDTSNGNGNTSAVEKRIRGKLGEADGGMSIGSKAVALRSSRHFRLTALPGCSACCLLPALASTFG